MEEPFDLFVEFGDADVTVVLVEIRERRLASVQNLFGNINTKGIKNLKMHDFLVFTVTRKTFKRCRIFVAEKMRSSTLGICGAYSHIRMALKSDHSLDDGRSRPRFVWEPSPSWTVSTTQLNKILNASGGRYNLLSANCWRYATDVVETLQELQLRFSRSMVDFQAERACEEARLRLERMKRPLPRDVARIFYNPFSRRNSVTWCRIANFFRRRLHKSSPNYARDWDASANSRFTTSDELLTGFYLGGGAFM